MYKFSSLKSKIWKIEENQKRKKKSVETNIFMLTL
jgi:hypothetical protein